MCIPYIIHTYLMWPSIKRYIRWLWEQFIQFWDGLYTYSLCHTLMHHSSSYHCCMVVTFLYSVALWAIQMVGWQLLFLPQPKAQARHEKPHIFFHSIDWLFDIHMNVFIYSMASEMALYLPELYSFCTIAVRGYNLNIAAKTSSSGLQIHTMVKAPPQS